MRRAELQPSVLVHGVQLLWRVPVPVPLLCAAHMPGHRSLVSVDCAGTLRLHCEDGRLGGTRQLSGPVCGLLYAGQVQQYVAWTRQELLLLDSSFTLLCRIAVQQGVSSCVYHPSHNLIFSGGRGGVLVWGFGHGTRSLVQQQSLSGGMTQEDKVTSVTLDSRTSHLKTCYAACDTHVWEHDLSTGTLRRVRRHLHSRAISSLLFSEQLHLLISGSRDGSIKVWGGAAQLVAVFVGHTGPVTAMTLISSGTTLVSGSEDASLRTWDLRTQEPMEEQRLPGALLGLDAFCSSEDYVVSYSSRELQVWQVQHLYQLHCPLGATVTRITVSEDRVLCVCADASVRLLSAATGEVIAALDVGQPLLGAEYCALQGALCALLADGHLLTATALTHPAPVTRRVKVGGSHSRPCCFSLFCAVEKEAAERRPREEGKEGGFSGTNHRFFCIIGLDDGRLQVYDGSSSERLRGDTEAHGPGPVTCVMCDPEESCVVSAGSDLTVKVWRFYPCSAGSLSPHISLYCAQPATHLCSLHSQLFVGFHDSSSATYSLVQYCLQSGRRSDHPNKHDHRDQITGLCSHPGLGLVASCGRDGTIRIWTEENRLLRLLRIHASPECLSFWGRELLVGIHGHIYRIALMKILPRPHQLRILCLTPPEKDRTEPGTRITSPNGHLVQRNSDQNEEEREGSDNGRPGADTAALSLLRSRDRELHLLQMGKLRARKKVKANEETKKEALEKYLRLIYREQAKPTVPDDVDPADLLRAPGGPALSTSPFVPLKNNRGFFTDAALGYSADSLPRRLRASFLAAGVVPNSALLQLLWPMKSEENTRRRNQPECLRPKEMSEKISEVEKPERSQETEERMEEAAEERMEEAAEENDEMPPLLQDLLATVTALNVSPTVPDTSPPPPPPAPSHQKPRPTRPQKTRLSRIPRPNLIQTKVFQEPLISVQPPPMSPPKDNPRSSSSSSFHEDSLSVRIPETPEVPEIPPFILQFQDQSWFSLVLPEAELRPAQYPEFESRLLRAIRQAEQPMGTHLLRALQTLHQQGHLKDPQLVCQTLTEVISGEGDLTDPAEQEFLHLCLYLMSRLSPESRDLVVELLVRCVQLRAPHRERFLALFQDFGVHDPQGFIAQKCSSWGRWEETGNSREDLWKVCAAWLQRWTARLTGSHRVEATPVHVLNYYCDVQMNKELLGLKDPGAGRGGTVLALPPIDRRRALLRLGESGMYGRRRDAAGGSFPALRPSLRSDIIPFIDLPVKKVTLSPFISADPKSKTPDLHRYFIVQQSYLEKY